MSERNLEVGIKLVGTPLSRDFDQLRSHNGSAQESSGVEISTSWDYFKNKSGILALGPRLEFSLVEVTGYQFREVPDPLLGNIEEAGAIRTAARGGVNFGVEPNIALGRHVGMNFFVTGGPERLLRYSGPAGGVNGFGIKAGGELLLVASDLTGEADWGLVLGLASLRTLNPATRQSEIVPELSIGGVGRF